MPSHKKMSAEEIVHIAGLVKLQLTPQEVAKFSELIPQTLATIDVLQELDTIGVEPTSNVAGLADVYRDGTQSTTLSQAEALANAPDRLKGLIATKGVFDRS